MLPRKIKAGQELLANYGRAYWAKGGFDRKGKRPRNVKEARAKGQPSLAMIAMHPHGGRTRSAAPVRMVRPPRGPDAVAADPTGQREEADKRATASSGSGNGEKKNGDRRTGGKKAAGGTAKYWRLRR